MTARVRLDRLLVERGLCESRSRAQALIMAGQVVVDDHAAAKPGQLVRSDAGVRLRAEDLPFVSRGGLKLAAALDAFSALDVRDRVAMDVGASTGGFTDCLLQSGVRRVYAVDVGYGQLAWKLAQDPRVVVHDRANIRHLAPETIGEPVGLATVDCSFISLLKVLPALPPFMDPDADLVVLVKPQFEVGREGVGKGGIVRDSALQDSAVDAVVAAAAGLGFDLRGRVESPEGGGAKNREFLVWFGRGKRV